ncbi:HPP family protein [Methylorubrum populi BJ001]|jgi:CBS-domain-containing membrane protein|uniref:HPP family protein n=1 Tax=Methylorubrum populi (strain ATCC BAA-705 / NCIMB 13946 / BJ001) TaxID=441620 RepID=B1Z8G6_METPB|nr:MULTISPECIES: HPP family protein [Methylorubrum]ACB81848.1 HPP family protein [Methylorubrum populi BJ001]MBB5765819.1 CBS-domain-containing membrane protein [Methylorubrum rhodesianum]
MASHQSLRQRFARAVPLTATRSILMAGLGGFGVIFLLAEVTARFEAGLLIAPFGASCVLVFGLPQSPLAQPRSVIGGYVVSTVMGLLVFSFLGSTALAFGLGVGLAIVTMLLTKTVHPPAGADPIVVILAGASWSFLVVPVLTGALTIVAAGMLFRRYVLRHPAPAH